MNMFIPSSIFCVLLPRKRNLSHTVTHTAEAFYVLDRKEVALNKEYVFRHKLILSDE